MPANKAPQSLKIHFVFTPVAESSSSRVPNIAKHLG